MNNSLMSSRSSGRDFPSNSFAFSSARGDTPFTYSLAPTPAHTPVPINYPKMKSNIAAYEKQKSLKIQNVDDSRCTPGSSAQSLKSNSAESSDDDLERPRFTFGTVASIAGPKSREISSLQHPRPQRLEAGVLLKDSNRPASLYSSSNISRVGSASEDREETKYGEFQVSQVTQYLYPGAFSEAFRIDHSSSTRPSFASSLNVSNADDRRARSMSPSLFVDEQNQEEGGTANTRGTQTPAPSAASKKQKAIDDKKKHGSYKIWHRNASEELQLAYNAIYGLPLYGSVAFIGKKPDSVDMDDEIQSDEQEHFTCVVRRFEGSASVRNLVMGNWDVEIHSAGKDDGDFAHIFINGHDYSENKRGFNIVVLVPETGEVKVETFDTHGLPEESEKLAYYISNAPAGSYILGAVRDDGAKFLGDLGRAALRLAGVSVPKADDALALQAVVEALPADRTRVLLTVCAKANAKNCAKVLLQNGWDIHTRASHTLNTPLHDAVYQKNTDIAIVLLDCGADASLENKWGETPENIAQNKFGYASLEHMIMSSDRHIQSVIRFIGLE